VLIELGVNKMRKEELLSVLQSPLSSEKASVSAGACPQYAFKVSMSANKHDIKKAVEQLFNVSVKSVNVLRKKGTVAAKFGRSVGRYGSWKKAYVVLEAGQEINF